MVMPGSNALLMQTGTRMRKAPTTDYEKNGIQQRARIQHSTTGNHDCGDDDRLDFAVVIISRARDHVRLMNSARQFEPMSNARAVTRAAHACLGLVVSNTNYSITMDWDASRHENQNFNLEPGVVFTTGAPTIHHWRGRIDGEQSFGLRDRGRPGVTANVHVPDR